MIIGVATFPKGNMVAAQVLRAMALNYPTIVSSCWERVSVLVYKILQFAVVEDPATTWKASVKEPVGYIGDKILTAAIKVGLYGPGTFIVAWQHTHI